MQVKRRGGSCGDLFLMQFICPVYHHGIVMVIIPHLDCENSAPDKGRRQHMQLRMQKHSP